MSDSLRVFNLYTFQIHPIADEFQFDLWGEIFNDVEYLKSRKAEIFREVILDTVTPFIHHHNRSTKLVVKVTLDLAEFAVMKIAAKREVQHFDQDLNEHVVDSFPSLSGIFHWPTQTVAIAKQPLAFQDTDIVASIIRHNADRRLHKYNLCNYIEPKFETKSFWDEMEERKGTITSLKFELISPNLPSISSSLPDDIKKLQKKTGSHEAVVELKGTETSPLKIDKSDGDISGLVDYAGEGGGKITFRAKGLRAVQKSGSVSRTISINETYLEGNAAEVESILKKIFK
jgi:hypothetical protein